MQKVLFLLTLLTFAACNKSVTDSPDVNGNSPANKKIATVQTFAEVSTNYSIAPQLPESVRVTLDDNTTENRKV